MSYDCALEVEDEDAVCEVCELALSASRLRLRGIAQADNCVDEKPHELGSWDYSPGDRETFDVSMATQSLQESLLLVIEGVRCDQDWQRICVGLSVDGGAV